jgi:hypothetical protein
MSLRGMDWACNLTNSKANLAKEDAMQIEARLRPRKKRCAPYHGGGVRWQNVGQSPTFTLHTQFRLLGLFKHLVYLSLARAPMILLQAFL